MPKPTDHVHAVESGEGWHVAKVTTPQGLAVCVPSQPLAVRISQEWQAYQKSAPKSAQAKPTPADTMPMSMSISMPMYCLAVTAIDRLSNTSGHNQRDACIHHLANYAAHELFCHRAASPPSLVKQQALSWQPWLDWAEAEYGVRLIPHTGLMPAPQPATSIARLREALTAKDDFALAAIQQLTSLSGSLVASLAVAAGHKTADEAFAASFLDELWQAGQWGSDDEAVARRQQIKKRMGEAETFLLLLAGKSLGAGKPT